MLAVLLAALQQVLAVRSEGEAARALLHALAQDHPGECEQSGAAYEDPAKEIQWARSWEKAYEEAKLRNVPIWVFVTSDT
jgi:hypothetical protein